MKRIAATLVACIALVAVPSAAMANSTCQSYSSQTCHSVNHKTKSRTAPVSTKKPTSTTKSPSTSQTAPTSATKTTSAATLPFTGLDIGLLAVGGIGLLGAGLLVRRLASE